MKNSLQPFSSQSNNTNAQIFNLNRAFQQNATTSSIRANIVSFNIYFNELTYNLISDSPQINWFSLFANLAGICGGSFLGMSFLAILEFLEYFFYMFFIMTKHGFLMLNSLIRNCYADCYAFFYPNFFLLKVIEEVIRRDGGWSNM